MLGHCLTSVCLIGSAMWLFWNFQQKQCKIKCPGQYMSLIPNVTEIPANPILTSVLIIAQTHMKPYLWICMLAFLAFPICIIYPFCKPFTKKWVWGRIPLLFALTKEAWCHNSKFGTFGFGGRKRFCAGSAGNSNDAFCKDFDVPKFVKKSQDPNKWENMTDVQDPRL